MKREREVADIYLVHMVVVIMIVGGCIWRMHGEGRRRHVAPYQHVDTIASIDSDLQEW